MKAEADANIDQENFLFMSLYMTPEFKSCHLEFPASFV